MTSPNADRPPEGRRFWKPIVIALGSGTLIVGTVAVAGAWWFVNQGLTPLLERQLSNLLERELELGDLQGLSWNGLRVGPSRLNATDTDPTFAMAEAVEVGFNPLQVLFNRELDIDLRLIGAEGYLEQHPDEGWLGIDIPTFEPVEDPLIKVRMDDIEIINSQVSLVPLPADGATPAPLLVTGLDGLVAIDPVEVAGQTSQRIEFEATATPSGGGNLDITGAVVPAATGDSEQPIQQEITLGINARRVAAETGVAFLLPTLGQRNLPLAALAGRVTGDWTVAFLPGQPVTVAGAGRVSDGQLQLTSLPNTGPWDNIIDDIDARARFEGTTITIERANASYESLNATATGTVNWQGDYDLSARVADVDLETLLTQSEVELPIVLSGELDSDITMTGPIMQPKLAAQVVANGPVTVDRVVLNDFNADVLMQSDRIEELLNTINITQVSAAPDVGGQLTGSGTLAFGDGQPGVPNLDFEAALSNVSGDAIASLYELEQLPVTFGIVGATASIQGPSIAIETQVDLQAPVLAYGGQTYPTSATAVFVDGVLTVPQARVQIGDGTVVGSGQVEADSWQADIVANNADVQALSAAFNQNLPGRLNANFALAGPTRDITLDTLLAMGNYNLQLAEGAIQGDAELVNGRWQTTASLNALGLSQFASQLSGSSSGTVSLAGRLDALTLADIQGQGDLSFSAGLAGLSSQLAGFDDPLTTRFAWTGRDLLIEEVSSAQLQARGLISPELDGNQILGLGGFALDLAARRYPLAALPVPVPLDGFATFDGRVVGTLSNPQLDGNLLLEQFGVNQVAFDPVLQGPVSYQPQTGLQVELVGQTGSDDPAIPDDVIAINFQSLRDLDFNINWQGAQASGRTEGELLRATLQELPLQALGLPTVGRLGGGLQGTLSSAGEWVVDLNRQTFVGEVLIDQPGLGYLNARRLTGQIAYREQRVFVERGTLVFNACSAQLVDAQALPSYCVSPTVPDSIYRFNGNVHIGTLAYNANVSVENGDVQDVLAAMAITDLDDLIQTFQSPTWLENPPSPEEVPDVLATQSAGDTEATLLDQLRRLAEIQEIQDQQALAEATNPIPSLEVLQGRFDAMVSINGTPEALPEIMFNLDGQDWSWGRDFVADRVIARGQLDDGNLVLQPVRLETALPADAEGRPQRAFVNLAGNLSLVELDSSSLQLVAEQLPIAALRDIFDLPVGLQGRLNAIANFSGDLGNPTLRGDIVLADGSINEQPIDRAAGVFLYENARLLLQGELLQVDNPQPLLLTGDIPYAFDFMTVQPEDDRIALNIDVADEGLALLNVLNDQVMWESGKGEVSLEVGGSLSNPTISGEMNVREAVLRSPLLPKPLTDFAGRVVFENDQITVQSLQGLYGDGQLQAAGTLPLGNPPVISTTELAALGAEGADADSETVTPGISSQSDGTSEQNQTPTQPIPIHPTGALTITLDNIDLELRGIYQGGVKGRLVVGGNLFAGGPQLGGVVEVADGSLFLGEGTTTTSTTATEEISAFVPRFENLKITLADNLQVQQGNWLNVVAQGDLRITGPLSPFRAIEPEGTIRLRSGRLNLVTTTFRLVGRENIARFVPERGLADPFLDLRLRTSIAETQQSSIVEATAFATSEVADGGTDFSQGATGIETIRIRANYQGTASKLLDSLFLSDISDTVIELSSSPPRSRQEIINLLTGSYVAALQSGQGVLNFFGSALINRIQDFVISNLSLSEFRIFPVTGASRFSNEDNTGSSLDVAGEVGFDVTDDITLSLVKILTDSTPTEFNLRYRLTDEFTIRGTSNFDDRNRVLLEFETRF